MNRKDIIRMAEQCGIPEFESNESQADNILRFAALVAAAEREACAKVAEEFLTRGRSPFGYRVAEAIRARGQA